MSSLSKAFAVMRARSGTSTIEIAKSTGMSIRGVQNQLAVNANPKFITIAILCEAIGCTVGELIAEYESFSERNSKD